MCIRLSSVNYFSFIFSRFFFLKPWNRRRNFIYFVELHLNGLVPLTDGNRAYAKRTQWTTKVSGLASSVFVRSKNRLNCRKICENKWRRTNKGSTYGSRMVPGKKIFYLAAVSELCGGRHLIIWRPPLH